MIENTVSGAVAAELVARAYAEGVRNGKREAIAGRANADAAAKAVAFDSGAAKSAAMRRGPADSVTVDLSGDCPTASFRLGSLRVSYRPGNEWPRAIVGEEGERCFFRSLAKMIKDPAFSGTPTDSEVEILLWMRGSVLERGAV